MAVEVGAAAENNKSGGTSQPLQPLVVEPLFGQAEAKKVVPADEELSILLGRG